MIQLSNAKSDLPLINMEDGFSYLYELLSHLTSSKQLFIHKVSILLQISSVISKSSFTRSELETLFPQYSSSVIQSIFNSLIESRWLIREEGTQYYSLSKAGLLFIRFLPFLYKGNELDESAFQFALDQVFQVAETMNLDIKSIEFLRDQAIHSLQRSIEEIKSAIISKNPSRIYETSSKMNLFLKVIDDFIKRLKELNKKKTDLKIPYNNTDRLSISILLATKKQIIELFDIRKKYLIEAALIGSSVFTKHDVDKFLFAQNFDSLSEIMDENYTGYVPSNTKWVDEYDIINAFNEFLSIKKNLKERPIGKKVDYMCLENFENGEDPYLIKVEEDLVDTLMETNLVDFDQFIFSQKTKVDVLMYIASLCFLEGQTIFSRKLGKSASFTLSISKENKTYQDNILKTLSKGEICRREKNE